MFRKIILVSMMLLLAASTAYAGGSPRAHDGGFLLRMSLGFGTQNTSRSLTVEEAAFFNVPGGDIELSGAASDFTITLGGIVKENLALHGTIFSAVMTDPDIEIAGLGSDTVDGTMGIIGYGGGLTYWFMPANVFMSASFGLGRLRADNDYFDFYSDWGFAMEATVGKDWFVSNRWGLGVAGGFTFHNVGDPEVDESWSGSSFTIRFNATFN
jgi:hypothetical protein